MAHQSKYPSLDRQWHKMMFSFFEYLPMQIIQFVFSVIIALCAVAMFVGAVITLSPIKVVSVTLLALICLFSLFLVKLAYCEMKSKNDIL